MKGCLSPNAIWSFWNRSGYKLAPYEILYSPLVVAAFIAIVSPISSVHASHCGSPPSGSGNAWAAEYAAWCSCMGGTYNSATSACSGAYGGHTPPPPPKVYQRGDYHPKHPNVIMGANGNWQPAPGYRWLNPSSRNDWRVEAIPKAPSPHAVAAKLVNQAEAARRDGRLEDAVRLYREALEHTPDNPYFKGSLASLLNMLGNQAFQRGDSERAAARYRHALQHFKTAADRYRQALQYAPRDKSYRDNLDLAEDRIKTADAEAKNEIQNRRAQEEARTVVVELSRELDQRHHTQPEDDLDFLDPGRREPPEPVPWLAKEPVKQNVVRDWEVLHLAAKAYDDRQETAGARPFSDNGDWRTLEAAAARAAPQYRARLKEAGFSAFSYVNERTKTIVVAIQGSRDPTLRQMIMNPEMLSDAIVDWWINDLRDALLRGENPPQFHIARQYVEAIKRAYGGEYTIICSGHSLGGGACVHAAGNAGVRAVVINPISSGAPLPPENAHLIDNYVVEGDFAQTVYSKVGRTYFGNHYRISNAPDSEVETARTGGVVGGIVDGAARLAERVGLAGAHAVDAHRVDRALDNLALQMNLDRVK